MNEPPGARARVALTGPTVAEYFRDVEEAETRAAAATAVALNKKALATFEGQSSDRIAKINGLTKATALLVKGMTIERFLQNGEIVGVLKRLKDVTSADLTALEKEGLDRKTNHQDLTKVKTEEICVLSKAVQEKETLALKLEQSARETVEVAKAVEAQEKAGALPRPARPPPW